MKLGSIHETAGSCPFAARSTKLAWPSTSLLSKYRGIDPAAYFGSMIQSIGT